MSHPTQGIWESFERQTVTAFLFAGVLLLGFAAFSGLNSFTDITIPIRVVAFSGGLGLLAASVGIVGLYPRINETAPRLSLAGVVAVLLAGVGALLVIGWSVISVATGGSAEPPAWYAVGILDALVLNTVGFLLYAISTLRTSVLSQTVGLLLFVPPVMWITLLVVGSMTSVNTAVFDVFVYLIISPALLALGYSLREGSVSTSHEPSAPDSIS